MNISDIRKIKWLKEERWNEKWYNVELCLEAFYPPNNPVLSLFTKVGFNVLVLNIDWYYDQRCYQAWDSGIEKTLEKISLFAKLISQTEKYLEKAEKTLEEIEALDTLNLKALKLIKQAEMYLWYVFLADFGKPLGYLIDQKFKEKGLTGDQIEKIKDYYFQEDQNLGYQQSEENLREIAQLFQKKYHQKIEKYADLSDEIKQLLTEHTQKYSWTTNMDLDVDPFDEENFFKSFKEVLNSPIKTKASESLNPRVRSLLTKEDIEFLELVRRHIYLDNLAADIYAKLDFLMITILSKQYGISIRELSWYSYDELEELVQNNKKLTPKNLKIRKEYRVMAQVKGEPAVFYGKKDFQKIKSLLKEPVLDNIKEFKGLVASKGVVTGTVRVVRVNSDMDKVEKGDILVAYTTRPDLMPAIRRAGAIITEAGGITSHAAIVSREFKIPCIVGTKIATRVLKDGDKVKVDANHGVVRILG